MNVFSGILAWIHRVTAPRHPIGPLVWPEGALDDPELVALLLKMNAAADKLMADDSAVQNLRELQGTLAAIEPALANAREQLEAAAAEIRKPDTSPTFVDILNELKASRPS